MIFTDQVTKPFGRFGFKTLVCRPGITDPTARFTNEIAACKVRNTSSVAIEQWRKNSSNRRKKKKKKKNLTTMKAPNTLSTALAIATILTISSSLSFVPCSSWQILTNHNFSSQIRLHQHVLLLITVPWSGESRSLMKEVSLIIAENSQEFSNLKLMFIHMNMEKTLADSLGANVDGITVIYFHYSVSYKYRGRLVAKSILSSLHFYISIAPEEVPFKTLNSARDFRAFLDSTDQALVLVDFCGWTPKLLAKSKKNNGTENGESQT